MGTKYENLLEDGSGNIVQSFFDNFLKSNADFRSNAGFRMTVIREPLGACCDWCSDLAGTYDYDSRPSDVYARHKNCNCIVVTKTERGTYQDAWSRKEYGSQREARIARERELSEQKGMVTPVQRMKSIEVAQSAGDSVQPLSIKGDFSDYKPLEISDEISSKLRELHTLAKDGNVEYGQAFCDGKWTEEPDTDKKHNSVTIHFPTAAQSVELYHSHTDESPPSSEDFEALCNPKISRIGIISMNGDCWVIDATYGIKPKIEELRHIVKMCYQESAEDLKLDPNFFNWTPEERYYMMIREGMRRTANYLEWEIMGGVLIE